MLQRDGGKKEETLGAGECNISGCAALFLTIALTGGAHHHMQNWMEWRLKSMNLLVVGAALQSGCIPGKM